MADLAELFERNRAWSAAITADDPEFFADLADQQSPEYLWIGCSDSRVPANQIVGLAPGEVFVHRNVANVVVHTDLNCLSVVQYAVDVLAVKHIIVCGHYGCGGVKAALEGTRHGLIDNWLRHISDVAEKHAPSWPRSRRTRGSTACASSTSIEQVANVCHTTIVQRRLARGSELAVHGVSTTSMTACCATSASPPTFPRSSPALQRALCRRLMTPRRWSAF